MWKVSRVVLHDDGDIAPLPEWSGEVAGAGHGSIKENNI